MINDGAFRFSPWVWCSCCCLLSDPTPSCLNSSSLFLSPSLTSLNTISPTLPLTWPLVWPSWIAAIDWSFVTLAAAALFLRMMHMGHRPGMSLWAYVSFLCAVAHFILIKRVLCMVVTTHQTHILEQYGSSFHQSFGIMKWSVKAWVIKDWGLKSHWWHYELMRWKKIMYSMYFNFKPQTVHRLNILLKNVRISTALPFFYHFLCYVLARYINVKSIKYMSVYCCPLFYFIFLQLNDVLALFIKIIKYNYCFIVSAKFWSNPCCFSQSQHQKW